MTLPSELPEIGEVIVCKITKIMNYGVFVELLEYDNVQGFIHISQVASSWIKNIRNFVKENQVRAAKVTNINRQKGQIDLSLTKVNSREQRAKIAEYGKLKKPQKLIEIIAKNCKVSADLALKEISEPLLENYDSLYEAFQAIRLKGEPAAKNIPKKYLKHLLEIIEKNIEIPQKTILGTISMHLTTPDGINVIKEALKTAEKESKKVPDAKIEMFYSGSGKYDIRVVAHDYKIAEQALKNAVDAATKTIENAKGEIKFVRSAS